MSDTTLKDRAGAEGRTSRSGLPEIAALTDTTHMRGVFQRQLAGSEGATSVLSCRVVRYRHRPLERCLVQYVVVIARGHSAQELRVTGHWYQKRGRAARLFRTLARIAPVRSSGDHPLVFFDEPSGMLATVFPFDRRLPALPAVVSGSDPSILAPMLRALGVAAGAPHRCQVELVRYREHLCAVCRYAVEGVATGHAASASSASPRAGTFFVKTFADDSGEALFLQWRELAAARSPRAARIVPPLAYVADRKALIVPEASGTPLDRLLVEAPPHAAVQLAGRVSVALARFGQQPLRPNRVVGRGETLDALARSVSVLEAAVRQRSAIATLGGRIADVTEVSVCGPAHRDIKLEHVLLDSDDVWLIDLDSCAWSDPVLDVALFMARLAGGAWASQTDPTWLDQALESVQQAYFTEAPRAWRDRLPALLAGACLEVAAGLIRRREPSWEPRADALIQRAERTLDR